MFEHTFVGLDVHAVDVVAFALTPETGEVARQVMAADPAVVLAWVRRFDPPVRAVYESGPTGYVLARFLRAGGVDCVVAASSKLLHAPGDRVKTDLLTELTTGSSRESARGPWSVARLPARDGQRGWAAGSVPAGGAAARVA